MKYLLSACILLMTTACAAGVKSLNKKSVKLSTDQTKERVTEIMGPPQNRQMRGSREAWQYCATNMNAYTSFYVIVWFDDGSVTQTSTYSQETTGGCQNHFRTIQW